eukprot:TRINITY_DN8823_c0_g1_i2.p3 TRINITY_DN8823_c0_g1~~TRINITY_DN8823_c0_g1_i2.p3  ORF type:complete len:188 (+),score=24.04 TRINITY_DN8823_c0_g1_i2:880-1443(+)
MFMLCFKKPPFESTLAILNQQYFIPENTYSQRIFNLLDKLLQPDPDKRLSAYEVLSELYSSNLINLDDNSNSNTITNQSQISQETKIPQRKSTKSAHQSHSTSDKLTKNKIEQDMQQSKEWDETFSQQFQKSTNQKQSNKIEETLSKKLWTSLRAFGTQTKKWTFEVIKYNEMQPKMGNIQSLVRKA